LRRFQRRIKLLPGVRINLSKSGVGFSEAVIAALLTQKNQEEAARAADISPATLLRWHKYQASLDTGARWKAALEGGAPPVGGQRTWIRGVRVLTGLSWILLALMGSLIGLAMLANPDGGPFQIYRALGGLIMLVCLARVWVRIRDFRSGNAR
jgi:hypothetical protein